MKKLIGAVVFILFAALLWAPVALFAIWFVPAALGLLWPSPPQATQPESRTRGRTRMLLGAALCWPWAVFLSSLLPAGWFESSGPGAADLNERQSPYSGALVPGELAGYVALVSIGGCIGLAMYWVIGQIARSTLEKAQRILVRRLAAAAVLVGGTYVTYKLAPGYWKLVAMVSSLVGTGFVIDDSDPRTEVE